MASDAPESKFPQISGFVVEHPLYERINADSEAVRHFLANILHFTDSFDAYCPFCKREATFRGLVSEETKSQDNQRRLASAISPSNGHRLNIKQLSRVGHHEKTVRCTRDLGHTISSFFVIGETSDEDGFIEKIGQFPSVADISIGEVTKYSSVLAEEKFREFKRGLGLAAHGIGIGSFVYLRRVFEHLVADASKVAATAEAIDVAKYSEARMDERIKMLRGYLPPFLVKNSFLYGILSNGIHELSESECLGAFERVRLGIEMILDDVISEQQRSKKSQQAAKLLSDLASDLGNHSEDVRT